MDRNHAVERLRERILIAAAGTLAAACGDAARPSAPPAASGAPPVVVEVTQSPHVANETPPATPAPGPDAAAPPTVAAIDPAPPGPTPPPRVLPQGCYEPRSTMRSVGTGEPASPPPPSAYDKNGCLPSSAVTNGCCNGATGGPRFKDGACCYSFPKMAPCCGRPFTIDGASHVAAVVAGAGWISARRAGAHDAAAVDPAGLDPVARRDVARGWLRDAQMEHASIASFARFVMDLVALGAPADLVREAGVALLDEVEHARLCFALASRFAGEPLAPAPLDAAAGASPSARSLEEILRGAVLEGCIGETAAAYVATQRLAGARDPEAHAALARIAEDEARHAELAFRFVAWAIRAHGDVARTVVAAAFDGECTRADTAPRVPDGHRAGALESLGLMTASDELAAMQLAVREIVRPVARRLVS